MEDAQVDQLCDSRSTRTHRENQNVWAAASNIRYTRRATKFFTHFVGRKNVCNLCMCVCVKKSARMWCTRARQSGVLGTVAFRAEIFKCKIPHRRTFGVLEMSRIVVVVGVVL